MPISRPSDAWESIDDLDPASEGHRPIYQVLSSINLDNLEAHALSARSRRWRRPTDDVTCTIRRDRCTWGFNNVVLEAAFSDGVFWIVRIPHEGFVAVDQDVRTREMRSEIAVMKLLTDLTTIPVPQIYHWSLQQGGEDLPVRHNFMLMEYIPGRSLDDHLAKAVPSAYQSKVAEQLADVFYQLSSLTAAESGLSPYGTEGDVAPSPHVWKGIDGAQATTSLEWFYSRRQETNRRALALHPNSPDWLTACWVLKSALPLFVIEEWNQGPFPLCHPDLHYGNMLFDDDYNLTGILDWHKAQTTPIEQLAVCPELMVTAAPLDATRHPQALRQLVIQALREKAALELSTDDQTGSVLTGSLEGRARKTASSDSRPKTDDRCVALADFMDSTRLDIAHRAISTDPRRVLWDGRLVAGAIYGDAISWDQLKSIYGHMPYC